MDGDEGRNRLKTFLLGGLVGASAVFAAVRRRPVEAVSKPRRGLAAFEDAPCYREQVERAQGQLRIGARNDELRDVAAVVPGLHEQRLVAELDVVGPR